jgi:hypothetical protein
MVQDTMTRSRLLEELGASGQEVLDKLRNVPAEALEKGCYENGWNARQVLTHVASIEWTYPRLIEVARKASQPQDEKPAEPAEKKPEASGSAPQGGIESYNDRQIARYADSSVAELLELFQTNRAATIAAVEEADEALFGVPIKSAGGARGPMAMVFNYVAVLHVRGHIQDVLNAANA